MVKRFLTWLRNLTVSCGMHARQWFVLKWRAEKQGHRGNFQGLTWHSLSWPLLSLHLGEEPKFTQLSLPFPFHPHWKLEANGVVLRLSSSTTIPPSVTVVGTGVEEVEETGTVDFQMIGFPTAVEEDNCWKQNWLRMNML